jgi:hypothetical protein
MSLTLVPAYGRDYKSKKAVLADWEADKDFLIQDMSSPHDGRYTNKTDCLAAGIKSVRIRYKSLTQSCVIQL